MEFSKKEIHTSVLTQSKYSQITVDDDFTIPDSKGDMEKIVAKEGHILLESMIPEDGKVRITGSVCVRVLYRTGGDIPRLCQFQSEIPFEDVVNCDGVSSSSQVDCHSQLEDLTVSMINSRKLEVRGLIGTSVNVYEEMCIDAATGIEQGEGVACQYRDVTYSQVVLAKRDVLKVREELEIPQNKPNIQEILWQCVALRNMETKAGDEKLLVRGEIEIFILYKGARNGSRYNPFSRCGRSIVRCLAVVQQRAWCWMSIMCLARGRSQSGRMRMVRIACLAVTIILI